MTHPAMTDDKPACYCENRVCSCTPAIVKAVERWIDPAPEPLPIKTPLSYNDAMTLLAQAAPDLSIGPMSRLVAVLQAVDVASRIQARGSDADLLSDVYELLTDVSEYADAEADVSGVRDEDGEINDVPNRAMKWQIALDDNYGGSGLLSRVERALEASK